MDWSTQPVASEFYDDLLRHLHVKVVLDAGINSLGEFAHNFETYLIGIERTPETVNDAFFAVLNQQQDEIHRRVEVYRKMSQGEASETEVASLPEAPVAPVSEMDAATSETQSDASTPTDSAPESTPAAPATSNQEMVRVSADLLEDLISLAGESTSLEVASSNRYVILVTFGRRWKKRFVVFETRFEG